MIDKPVFKPSFRVEVVDPEGVFLLSEKGHFVLKGKLNCRLAPLLDGYHTTEDIVEKVAGEVTPAEAYYALGYLEKKGYIVEADGTVPSERAAFWDMLGLDPRSVEIRLKKSTVSLVRFGAVSIRQFASALAELNVQEGEDGDFAIALTDDYLQDGLRGFNTASLAVGRPWMVVKPVGTVLWIGPVFRPGKTGCWECLAQRLRLNRHVESYLQNRNQTVTSLPFSRTTIPATVQIAFQMASIETAKVIAHEGRSTLEDELITLDLLTLKMQSHTLVRRPQCPSCGNRLAYRPDREPVRVMLQNQKMFAADGGYRVAVPEKTIENHEHHVSPITGAVPYLARLSERGSNMHVYIAGHNLAMKYDNLHSLRQGLRSSSGGKGITDAQARASGLCEALERYSGTFLGEEIRKLARYRQLGSSAIHPNACMLFSEKQYRRRQEWNAQNHKFQRVPHPFDEGAAIEWTPVWSFTNQEFKYLPTSYCYYGGQWSLRGQSSCWADSNGNAAGNTVQEAILHGFMELVERDSVCLWWYNRVRLPAVDLDSFDEPYIQTLRKEYRKLNRELWVLDLTSDLRIPVFAAVSRRTDQAVEDIMFGFGAHFDARIAVLRALTEMNQFIVLMSTFNERDEYSHDIQEYRRWSQTATLANQPYLMPKETDLRARSEYDFICSEDLRDDVLRCQEIVERQGMEMLVLDQTRPDIGLPVAKVFVPGLRHFWRRLGPGRLYDVPVKLGWLNEPLAEDELNPISMFL